MQFNPAKRHKISAFTFAEVVVAMAVCILFGAAAFATNQRLLKALKAQRETTAATLLLQERMEAFRGFAYSNIANKDYVKNNVVKVPTTSEAVLPNLTETITVSGYMSTAGATPAPSVTPPENQWIRTNAQPNGQEQSHDDNLATNYDLLKVEILINWTGTDGRSRTRDMASLFGKGNIGN